jgi:hypothetical protein
MMPAAILPAGEFVSAGTMASSAPGVVGTVMEPAASMFAPTMLERAATLGSNIMGGGDTIINNVGSSLAKQGVAAGMNALSSRGEEKAAKSFNEQLAGLIQRSNNQTYGAAQAVPLNTPANTPPGLTGTRGAVDPSATVAASGRPAPSMGAGAAPVSGTPNAPAAPRGSQDGAVKLGTRPRMYAG